MAIDIRRKADRGLSEGSFAFNQNGWTDGVPSLVAAFDTETTGLSNYAEAITFGLAIFRDGKHCENEDQHFAINPLYDITPDASRVHGWSKVNLEDSHSGARLSDEQPRLSDEQPRTVPTSDLERIRGEHDYSAQIEQTPSFGSSYDVMYTPDTNERYVTITRKKNIAEQANRLPPALGEKAGTIKMAEIMASLQRQGFLFVSANQKNHQSNEDNIDVKMIKGKWNRTFDYPIETTGFVPKTMRLLDVVRNDHLLRPDAPRHNLTSQAKAYEIPAGGHQALNDAITAGRIFIEGHIPSMQQRINSRTIIRRSFKATSNLGIDFSGKGGPHNSKGPCGFCLHLDELKAGIHANNPEALAEIERIREQSFHTTRKNNQ